MKLPSITARKGESAQLASRGRHSSASAMMIRFSVQIGVSLQSYVDTFGQHDVLPSLGLWL
jgi:hypothetical protein